MQKKQLLEEISSLITENITREEFLDSFKKVLEQVLQIETKALKKVNIAIEELNDANNASLEAIQADLKGFQSRIEQSTAKTLKEQENGLNFIRDKVRKIKEGKDGQDGQSGRDGKDAIIDQSKIIQEVLNKIKLPEIDKTEMETIKKEWEVLRDQKVRFTGGGGFSYIAMTQHIINDETPSGTKNGVNTTFTLASAPNPTNSLKLYKNGQRLKITEDYTISGITITFIVAPLSTDILTTDYMK